MRCLRVLVLGSAVLAMAGAALGGERKVPGQYSTIQAAVDASAAGDVVVCAPGTYAEAVTATKSNITIEGYGATWDGKSGTDAVTCLDLTGSANVVSGFTFKNGKDHVRMTGDDCKVKDAVSLDAGASFCVLVGARASVTDCTVKRAKGAAVKVVGNAAACLRAKIEDCEDVACDIEGDDAEVKSCRVERCDRGAIRCKGESSYCYGNEAYDCGDFGFRVEGDACVAISNYAESCGSSGGAGFLWIGNGGTMKYCDTWACRPKGHHIKGSENWCHDNWSDYDEECGFEFEGDDNECESGRARYGGGDGHRVRGDRNRFEDCESNDNDDDGFDCESGADNEFRWCTAKRNGGAGCENGGTGTDLYACVLLYNAIDIGLDGSSGASFGSLSFNVFGSGSVTTILKIGLGL
jgi:hypothetical protein